MAKDHPAWNGTMGKGKKSQLHEPYKCLPLSSSTSTFKTGGKDIRDTTSTHVKDGEIVCDTRD